MKTAFLLLAFIGSCLITVNGVDFTLKRYGRTVKANSVLDINRVGREYQQYSWNSRNSYTNDGPLVCHTVEPHCCRNVDDPIENEENGEWFYPDGNVVGSSQQSGNLYVTRGRQELYLHSYSARGPTGVYCCDIQTVNSSGNITAEYVSDKNYTSLNSSTSKCVGLYTSYQLRLCRDFSVSNGWVEYDTPYIPGRVASISCSPGYTLINGSSQRTCTNSGWSGTSPSCAYDCGSLPNPRNGRVDTSRGTTVGRTATYSCNEGYHLIGSATQYCEDSSSRYYRNRRGWSNSAPICVDEAPMQLRFSPAPGSCLEWDNSRVNALRQAFIVTIQQVLVDHLPIVLPEVSADNFTHSPLQSQRSFFSCRNSVTDVHFRTTFDGLVDVSAHDLVKAVQNWAATGPSIRVQWYVVDIDQNCPVAISSDVAPECVDF